MNELIMREMDIDWLKIIDMAFKKKEWGKTYTLYTCRTATIDCEMENFDFRKNVATFRLTCKFPNENIDSQWNNYKFLEYHMDNFTLKQFKVIVLKKIIALIESIVDIRTKRTAENKFRKFRYWSADVAKKVVETYGFAEDYSKIENISDDSVRVDCIDTMNNAILEKMNQPYKNKILAFRASQIQKVDGLDEIHEKIVKKLKNQGEEL